MRAPDGWEAEKGWRECYVARYAMQLRWRRRTYTDVELLDSYGHVGPVRLLKDVCRLLALGKDGWMLLAGFMDGLCGCSYRYLSRRSVQLCIMFGGGRGWGTSISLCLPGHMMWLKQKRWVPSSS